MRKAVFFTMGAFFVFAVITGITESHVHPGQSEGHTVITILFIVSIFLHILINRKAFMKYFAGKTLKAGQPASDRNK
jgi:hypothetical protein